MNSAKAIPMLLGLLWGAVLAVPAQAVDLAAGKDKYKVCAGCHGPTGLGNAALGYPQLAGKEASYVAEQLRAFKSGRRESATMQAMVTGLSESDIDNVAAYVATLR
ncbi:MAG: cytochrome c [Gammaproteobacteria bacterium]|nr:MAG: cytochrome c [Gammaproteobacteria bacterium]